MVRRRKIPLYLKKSRVIVLSKDEENKKYPKEGNLRTIAISSSLLKLFELCIK
jgi:hypothetical protein